MALTMKSLVIDACVARAAGETEHPVSSSSRAVLEILIENPFVLRLPPELRKEWRFHSSRYSRRWLVRMHARRRVDSQKTTPPEGLVNAIEKRLSQPTLADVEKDLFLISAALEGDKIVMSLDEKARRNFALLAEDISMIANVIWNNPCDNPIATQGWLKEGAKYDAAMALATEYGVRQTSSRKKPRD